jgi:hypothetical protein
MAIGGIAAVGLAIAAAVALIASLVYRGIAVPPIAAATFATFVGLWFIIPVVNRGPRLAENPLTKSVRSEHLAPPEQK